MVKTVELNSERHGSAVPRRSAMGEYVPPAGGRPLSSHYYPTPGPSAYSPSHKLTRKHTPSYSMQSRPYPLKKPSMPSPTKYKTGKDAVWDENKTFTLGRKSTTWPYDTKKDSHVTCSPGSGHYLREVGDTGSGGRRQSVGHRHRDGVNAGHPSLLVQPVDTLGFSTPGPYQFRPESERGQKHSIGTQLKKKDVSTIGPGPASYSIPREALPTPYFGERLITDTDQGFPAPNEYSLPDNDGLLKSFGIRTTHSQGGTAPPPNQYYIRNQQPSSSHGFTFRPFEMKSDKRPGPCEYVPSTSSLPHAPGYGCRQQNRPVFPDILNYPEHTTLQTPGAGSYEYDREFKDNSNPAHTIALPLIQPPNTNPAPNQYQIKHSQCSTLPRPPSHSIGRLGREMSQSLNPGPADYNPSPPSAGSHSFTPRRNTQKVLDNPAPNCYTIEGGQTHRGQKGSSAASMKGRPTPVLYSGFPSSYMHKLQSLSS